MGLGPLYFAQEIYKIDMHGWRVPRQDYKASGIWKSILSVKVEFDKWIRYKAHSGLRIRFWHDEWCGRGFCINNFQTSILLIYVLRHL